MIMPFVSCSVLVGRAMRQTLSKRGKRTRSISPIKASFSCWCQTACTPSVDVAGHAALKQVRFVNRLDSLDQSRDRVENSVQDR